MSCDNFWGKSISGRGNSECKGPEVGVYLSSMGKNQATVAKTQRREERSRFHRATVGHCEDFEVILLEEAASGPLHMLIPLPGMLFPPFFV